MVRRQALLLLLLLLLHRGHLLAGLFVFWRWLRPRRRLDTLRNYGLLNSNTRRDAQTIHGSEARHCKGVPMHRAWLLQVLLRRVAAVIGLRRRRRRSTRGRSRTAHPAAASA